MTLEIATNFAHIAFVGLCLFCGQLLLLRRRDPGVYLPLALLFLFMGSSSLIYLITATSGITDRVGIAMRVSVMFELLKIACPFLFWLYVQRLTSEGLQERVPRLRSHLIAILVVVMLTIPLMFLPPELNDTELSEDHPAMARLLLIALSVTVADFLFKIMIGVYLFLIFQRLRVYRTRLRDIFSSTENREMTWIWGITVAGVLFWLFGTAISVGTWTDGFGLAENSDLFRFLESVFQLVLFWAIGIWGLRQRPGLTRDPVAEPEEPEASPIKKYEKSALDDERASRIARKIEAAMTDDLLYRNPNLSLWDLAKHIGVTSHYVSQTLNTMLGSSFFDYINRWRIDDAIEQLTATDETILMITHDVGFNSRSAFYKAFKGQTGKTPSDFRK